MNYRYIMENVTKRDGRIEPLNLDKIHKLLNWASEGLDNVSVSEVEMKSKLQFFDRIKTKDIFKTLVKSTADMITEETPNYQYMAARLLVFNLRKVVFGDYRPIPLLQHIKKLIDLGFYDETIVNYYTEEEINYIDNNIVDHERDYKFSYVAIKQFEGKYLVQNRLTRQCYETPQFLYIMISMTLFREYNKDVRLKYVKDFYDAISLFKISLPTPIMAGVRTRSRQFSSCVLIECDDSLDSINATTSSIVKYVSQKAGIGINAGKIRALGSPIRNGEAVHTGCIPFIKLFQSAVKSCSQGGIRSGSATVFFPIWHLEVENFLVLKNNRGIEDNRARHLDYGVQISKLFYQRFLNNEYITLFSPSDVDGLYDAFFSNQKKFEELYVKYENDDKIRKKRVRASELFGLLVNERSSTGRIYIQNIDHSNTHSAFIEDKAPIRQSNLCLEITLPTKPLNNVLDPDGEIALCTLAAFNLGELENLEELENLSDLLIRAMNELLDYQDYLLPASKKSTLNRRSLGIGVINYAYYLAKNNCKYSDGSANNLTHRTFEAVQYYLLKASNNLAKEKGPCPEFGDTKYSRGILPIDTYKKDVDELCNEPLHLDWETLRDDIVKYGLRNSTLTALMPSETSSQISNATNGIEPPRGFVSIKTSKDGVLRQVVPEIFKYKDKYELLWDLPNIDGYLKIVAIIQKFVDQSISTNTSYDPSKYPDNKVPMSVIIKDILTAYKYGIKTLYYHNTRDRAGEQLEDNSCSGGACKI